MTRRPAPALLAAAAAAALSAGRLAAQPPAPDTAVLQVAGAGPVTYVLVAGLVGGPAQYGRLRAHLLGGGARVVTVDPYRLSLDSADVTFAALARRVEALLAPLGVRGAQVVGHAHGAGVALRLAARAPDRVAALTLLDAGALAENRTRVFSASLRLAPLVARLPGGRGFVRGRFVKGLRENAGARAWLDAPTARAYTEPVLDRLPAVVAMAGRLAAAREPEPVGAVVGRVRAPVTVLLGDAPHAAAPDAGELAALTPLGARLRVVRLAGVGHFPHQEAPALVARAVAGGAAAGAPAAAPAAAAR